MRDLITFTCTIDGCSNRYASRKNKKNTTDRLEMSKYCKVCRKHTLHREKK